MANHETIVTGGGGDSGAGLVIGIVLAVALIVGALWLFNNGFFTSDVGSTVQVNVPPVTDNTPAK